MNTTFKNHEKMINLMNKINMNSITYAHDILFQNDESIGECYFKIIKKHNLKTIEEIFCFFFEYKIHLINCGSLGLLEQEDVKEIINFISKNLNTEKYLNFEIFEGKKVFGDTSYLYQRGIKRMKDKEERVFSQPYLESYEKDYATAIEIETIKWFNIPFIRINTCEEGYFCGRFEHDNISYSERTVAYDERAYGTHYM